MTTGTQSTDRATLREELARLEHEVQRRVWRNNPAQWARDRLHDTIWSRQEEILLAVQQHRRTAVMTAHSVGKSFGAAVLAGWWLDIHAPGDAYVVTTAPTGDQVKSILWKEIGRVFVRGELPGRVNQTEWIMNVRGKEEIVAMGRKPNDYEPTAFQGIHCLAEDHQILTKRGWLGIDEILESDLVLSVPCNGDTAEWMPITQVHRYPFAGNLRVYNSRTVSFAVTDEHRFPMKNQWDSPQWELHPVSENWAQWLVRRTSKWEGEHLTVPEPFQKYAWDAGQFAEFLGVWIGDGGLRQHSNNGLFYEVLIYQTKPDNRAQIEEILHGTIYNEYEWGFAFSDRDCAEWLLKEVGRYQTERRIPRCILEAPPVILEQFLEGFWLAEGTFTSDGQPRSAYTTSRVLADGIQEIQIKLGKPASIGINRRAGAVLDGPQGVPITAKFDCLTIGWADGPGEGHCIRRDRIQSVPYEGRVWCISTPYETFYTRRNGKVVLSGNSSHVLVIVDEANGVRGPLWDAMDSLISNEGSKMLAIGNPDVPTGEFYEMCRPGSGCHVVQISAFDSPNFTGELIPDSVRNQLVGRTYVEEKRLKWAPSWAWTADGTRCVPPHGTTIEDSSSPLWQSKILGRFPSVADESTLIPMEWIRRAREISLIAEGETILGHDVGGGGDSSTIACARGPVVRILSEDHNPDTMQTCGKLLTTIRETGATTAHVDVIGIGRGVVDRAQEVRREIESHGRIVAWRVIGLNVSESAFDSDTFENRRAELWWAVRSFFERTAIDIDPLDDVLESELASIRFERTSRGRIKIESKVDARRRGIRSPNRADALMLALARVPLATRVQQQRSPTVVGEQPSYWGELAVEKMTW